MVDGEILARALAGDPVAVRAVIEEITPTVQKRVADSLYAHAGAARGRNLRQELDDLVQEVMLELFRSGGHTLSKWDRHKGTLKTYVGTIAERVAASILRSRPRSPWTEDPTLMDELVEGGELGPTPEAVVASRELCATLLDRLRDGLSDRDRRVFQLLLVEEQPLEWVGEVMGMERGAIYTVKSRIIRKLRDLARELEPGRPVESDPRRFQ